MTCTLFVHCSPHRGQAHGYRLAQEILRHISRHDAQAAVLERDLTCPALPPLDAGYAAALTGNAPAHDARFTLSEHLIGELERSDRTLIALPMHNFAVPAAFKLWIDYVVRIHRSFAPTAQGKAGLLADRPTTMLVSSGGFHRGTHAQPDFLSPYVQQVLATIGIRDVTFHYLQGLTCDAATTATTLDAVRDQLRSAGLLDQPA
ncbi:NAD(P)H-dependent oxidoreductase [uncultured Salinisphaera sp.]|uniref:FMN-dependent NADH-azoreductase n=1 Tax=uncultured Salinisphaera sp. TaxID=359372 RepID=UPI0032B304C9